MSDDHHLDLTLHFDAGTVNGQLRADSGSMRAFHGWLGLMAALDQLREADDETFPGGGRRRVCSAHRPGAGVGRDG